MSAILRNNSLNTNSINIHPGSRIMVIELPTLMGQAIPSPRIIKVAGTPYDMGKQHGEQLKSLIHELSVNTKSRYEKIGVTGDKLNKIIDRNLDYFRKVAPDRVEELEGMAEGAKMGLEELFATHFCHEIECAQSPNLLLNDLKGKERGCTAFAATREATIRENTFLAMNTDASLESMRFRVIIRADPSKGYKYISHSRATDNGGYGLNEKGVAIVAPTVRCKDSVDAFSKGEPSGIYDRAISRTVLSECADIDEALDYIKIMPGGYQGLNILLMDGNGDIAKIERSYNKINIIYPNEEDYAENHVMAGTNHYASKEMNHIGPQKGSDYPNSYKRYDRVNNLLIRNSGKIDINLCQIFARDHTNKPDSICRHGEKIGTNCSLIAHVNPKFRRVLILWGTPCENKYISYNLS